MQAKRGQVNEPRNIAVFFSRKRSGLRLEDIGQEFGISTYSSVSSSCNKIEITAFKQKKTAK